MCVSTLIEVQFVKVTARTRAFRETSLPAIRFQTGPNGNEKEFNRRFQRILLFPRSLVGRSWMEELQQNCWNRWFSQVSRFQVVNSTIVRRSSMQRWLRFRTENWGIALACATGEEIPRDRRREVGVSPRLGRWYSAWLNQHALSYRRWSEVCAYPFRRTGVGFFLESVRDEMSASKLDVRVLLKKVVRRKQYS